MSSGGMIYETIWDAGGTDTLDFYNFNNSLKINGMMDRLTEIWDNNGFYL